MSKQIVGMSEGTKHVADDYTMPQADRTLWLKLRQDPFKEHISSWVPMEGGLFLSLVHALIFQVSNLKPDTLLSSTFPAHHTHSQVSFPFMPSIVCSPLEPHRPLQAQKHYPLSLLGWALHTNKKVVWAGEKGR